MSDFLLELSRHPQARRIIKSLGLPIPLPQPLRRATGPWEARPLHDHVVVVGSGPGGSLAPVLADILTRAGANPAVCGGAAAAQPYLAAGEAWSRPPTVLNGGEPPERFEAHSLLFDGTGIEDAAGLHELYELFHTWLPKLRRCGRVVVLSRPSNLLRSPSSAAAQAALLGFTRSVAKEVGKKGSVAQLIRVDAGAEERLAGPLRFLLSDRSAYISGQPFDVTAVAQPPAEVRWTNMLEGKVALVTGAARGIGAATAKLLAAEGAHVMCLDRPEDDGPASQIAREVGGTLVLVDVSAPEAPAKIVAALEQEGGVDVVVHNAGVTRDRTIVRMTPDKWDQVIDINLTAVIRITEALLEGPLHDHGRIICLSSIAGIAGNMGQTNYAASKAGIIGLVEQLAPAVADRGITVNAVAPGFIETRLTNAIPVPIREVGRRLNNLGQGGVPADVGEVITFLASPGASGLTGAVIRVCGGSLLGA